MEKNALKSILPKANTRGGGAVHIGVQAPENQSMRTLSSILAKGRRFLSFGNAVPRKTPVSCMNCGFDEALILNSTISPDFDTSTALPKSLRRAFMDRMDGICVRCGFYQAYKRFSEEQLRFINTLGKDITTRETAFHSFPPPPDFVERFNKSYFGVRLEKWGAYLDSRQVKPARCLFLRPYFGAAPRFMQERYGSQVAGVDMSPICTRVSAQTVPGYQALGGFINGMFEGDFLKSGPYDAVFVFHTLIHSIDIHRMVGQIRGLVKPGGFAMFTHEVTRKPNNPFHMAHLSEPQLLTLLAGYFDRVDRIDGCDESPPEFITRYSVKGDSADFCAWAG